jgi:hypothetical protein
MNSTHTPTPTPLQLTICHQVWNVGHKPWVVLVEREHTVIARGFGDTEYEALDRALAKVTL